MSGLFSKPKAPKAPNPEKTAAAQAKYNQQTAQAQAKLAMTGQTTTTGRLDYVADPSSPSGYRAVTSLSPEQQALYNQQVGNQSALGGVATRQIGNVSDALSQPVNLSNEAVEGRLMELGRSRLDPIFSERSDALETNLINRGIRPGSRAYESMRDTFGRERTDAYNQLLLSGRGQAVSEALAERDQPLRELQMLLGFGAPSSPQFQQTPAPGVAPVDYTSTVNNNYAQQMGQHNAMLGGLAGIASAPLGGWAYSGFKNPFK